MCKYLLQCTKNLLNIIVNYSILQTFLQLNTEVMATQLAEDRAGTTGWAGLAMENP